MSKKSSKWYKAHINDEFVKLANKENWRSRAVYKLKEIDEKYSLIKKLTIKWAFFVIDT